MIFLYFIILVVTLWPQLALAGVSISEVAWMGGPSSANHEWIELFNDGVTEPVEGWTLSDGLNLSITLSGSILSGAYAVLERTSEASAPGTAFLIYTGALVNNGATLVLRDASGNIIDQVSGGENWINIGGNNTTKETAQYSLSGWITAEATPGIVNKTASSLPAPTPIVDTTTSAVSSSGSSKKSSNNKSVSVNLENPETKLVLTSKIQSIAYVNQLIPLVADALGIDDHKNKLVEYDWNFGDTHYANSKRVFHAYSYPGEYIITVKATYKKEEQISRHNITVLPVNFSIYFNDAGNVLLNNDAPYDVDVSGYKLKGVTEVVFPPRSIIASRSTITIAKSRLGGTPGDLVILYDTKNNLIASTLTKPGPIYLPVNIDTADIYRTSMKAVAVPQTITTADFTYLSGQVELDDQEEIAPVREAVFEEKTAAPSQIPRNWPFILFIVIILVAIGIVLFSSNSRKIEKS